MRPKIAVVALAGAILPSLPTLVKASSANKDCHGSKCNPLSEFCSQLTEFCEPCTAICDKSTHNYSAKDCDQHCVVYNEFSALKEKVEDLESQLRTTSIIVWLLIAIIVSCTAYKLYKSKFPSRYALWSSKKNKSAADGNKSESDYPATLNVTTLQRVASPNSVGMLSPNRLASSPRIPTEVSTLEEKGNFGYDNKALAVTPIDVPAKKNAPF